MKEKIPKLKFILEINSVKEKYFDRFNNPQFVKLTGSSRVLNAVRCLSFLIKLNAI